MIRRVSIVPSVAGSFGISGLFTDIDDNRTHGRDARIPIDGFYQDVELIYRMMKTLSAAE